MTKKKDKGSLVSLRYDCKFYVPNIMLNIKCQEMPFKKAATLFIISGENNDLTFSGKLIY